jgi:hypothetical protein
MVRQGAALGVNGVRSSICGAVSVVVARLGAAVCARRLFFFFFFGLGVGWGSEGLVRWLLVGCLGSSGAVVWCERIALDCWLRWVETIGDFFFFLPGLLLFFL